MRQENLCDGCKRPVSACPVEGYYNARLRVVEVIFDGNRLLRAELCNDCRKRVAETHFGLRPSKET